MLETTDDSEIQLIGNDSEHVFPQWFLNRAVNEDNRHFYIYRNREHTDELRSIDEDKDSVYHV